MCIGSCHNEDMLVQGSPGNNTDNASYSCEQAVFNHSALKLMTQDIRDMCSQKASKIVGACLRVCFAHLPVTDCKYLSDVELWTLECHALLGPSDSS